MGSKTRYYIHGRGGPSMSESEYFAYKAAQAAKSRQPRYSSSGAPQLYQQRYGEATNLLDQLSDEQRQELLRRYGALRSNTQSQLIGSGLQATTILPSMMRGIGRAEQSDMNSLNDQLARERLGMMSDFTAGQAGAMQSDANARNSFSLSGAQMLQQQQQFASQQAMELARLNSYGNRYGGSSSRSSRGVGRVTSPPFTGHTDAVARIKAKYA